MFAIKMMKADERRRVVRVDLASAIACYRQSVQEGFKVRVKQLFVDVLVGNYEGDFVIVRKKVAFDEAEEFQRHWLMNERDAGCILWPSETPMPTEWRLVDDSTESTHSREEEPCSIEREITSVQQSVEYAIG